MRCSNSALNINTINMSQDKVFADGFLFKRRENAPELKKQLRF
jgi:hypothetical protein